MEEEIRVVEEFELIAIRIPPGDRWRLVNADPNSEPIDGIVEAMSEYMRQNDFKGDYRLSPLDKGGRIYAIKESREVIKPEPVEVKKYDLYGEY
jgi:hypothetical protein